MLATIETTPAPSQPVAVPERTIGYTIVDSPSPLPLGRLLVGATTRGVCAVRLGRSDPALEAGIAGQLPRPALDRGRAPPAPWGDPLLRHLPRHAGGLRPPLATAGAGLPQRVR